MPTKDQPSPDDQRQTITRMIQEIGTAMMVTAGEDGSLHARPMATAKVSDRWRSLFFASRRDSGKIEELANDSHVCLTYVDTGSRDWLSLSGTARVVADRKLIKDLWSDAWKNWFDGPEDEDLVLIEVKPTAGEYWDQASGTVVAAKLALAAVTGSHHDLGEHGKVSM